MTDEEKRRKLGFVPTPNFLQDLPGMLTSLDQADTFRPGRVRAWRGMWSGEAWGHDVGAIITGGIRRR